MTITIGLVGAGFIGLLHARNLAASPLFTLTTVAEPNPAAARRVAEETGARVVSDWQDLLGDPSLDAVLLASPAELHSEQIVAFAKAGKHIFCEKPLALNLEDADRAVAAAEEAGVLLQIDFNRRLDPHHAVLRKAVADGKIGAPLIVNIISRDPGLPGPDYKRAPGKMFMDTTIHDFDMARYLAGSEITEVSALSAATIDELARDADDADTTVIALRFANGALGIIDNSRQALYGYDQRAEVLGTAGMASCGNVEETVTSVATASGFASPPLPTFFPERYAESFRLAVDGFAQAITDGAPLPSDGKDGRAAIALALAAETSRRERRVVAL